MEGSVPGFSSEKAGRSIIHGLYYILKLNSALLHY